MAHRPTSKTSSATSITTRLTLLIAASAVLLGGCLPEQKPPAACQPGEAFELPLPAQKQYGLPSGLVKKVGKGKASAKAADFWAWYKKWLAHKAQSRLGRDLYFTLIDDRLDQAQFSRTQLQVEAFVFNVDRIRWDRVTVNVDGIKGTQTDASAVKVEILETIDFDKSFKASKRLLDLASNANSKDDKNKGKNDDVELKTFARVKLTLDLKKFSFGSVTTADDLIRKTAQQNRTLEIGLRHIDGWFRVVKADLNLAGQAVNACPSPTPTATPSPSPTATPTEPTPTPTPTPVPDTRAPVVQIDSQAISGLTSIRSQTITVAADEDASFTCSFDLGAWEACGTDSARLGRWSKTDLSDGEHQVSFRAQDSAGNTSAVLTVQWTVDATAPILSKGEVSPSESLTASTSLELSFSANETIQATCSLDGQDPVACQSPVSLSDLADGSHVLEIKATDLVGNVSAPLLHQWSVQARPPSVEILGLFPSQSPTSSTNITFEFVGAQGTKSYLCKLDDQAAKACSSPLTISGLGDGSHTFEIRAVDGLNRPGVAATYAWTVDTIAPDVFLTAVEPAQSPTSSTTARISFGSNESASFLCSLDGQDETPCASPAAFAGLSEGQHSFRIRATDTAGNETSAPAEYVWIVDHTAPVTVISAADPDGSLINTTSVTLTFAANESADFECRVDAQAFAGCSSPAVFAGLSDGLHRLEVRAVDRAQNIGAAAAHQVTVDTQSPGVRIVATEPAADITRSQTRVFSFASEDESARFECSLDGAAFAACSSPYSIASLSEGDHVFRVRALDAAGNPSSEPAVDGWRVDLTAPETTLIAITPSENPTYSTSISFDFSAGDETGATFECRRDNAAFELCSSPLVINNLAEGTHSFEVRGIDQAGNVDASPAVYNWEILVAPPKISGFNVTGITRTSATIVWTTDRPASSRVEYVNVLAGTTSSVSSSVLKTSHSITINGLTANTLYSVTAISTATGQTVRTDAYSFRTAR